MKVYKGSLKKLSKIAMIYKNFRSCFENTLNFTVKDDHLVVVATDGHTMVIYKERSEDVKEFLETLSKGYENLQDNGSISLKFKKFTCKKSEENEVIELTDDHFSVNVSNFPKIERVIPVKFKAIESIGIGPAVYEIVPKIAKIFETRGLKVEFTSDRGPFKLSNKDRELEIIAMPMLLD